MNKDFLQEKNWPKLDGRASDTSKQLHEWCCKISHFLLNLSERMAQLETKDDEKKNEINKMKSDLEASKKVANFGENWVQVVKQGAKMSSYMECRNQKKKS